MAKLTAVVEFEVEIEDATAAVVLRTVLEEKGGTQFSKDCSLWEFNNISEKLINVEVTD